MSAKQMSKKEWVAVVQKAVDKQTEKRSPKQMTTDELVELAYIGHASSRDAIRFAIKQEREACAKLCEEEIARIKPYYSVTAENCVKLIRSRT